MADTIISGISVALGIAIGKAYFVNRNHKALVHRQTVPMSLVEAEAMRLRRAFEAVTLDLEETRGHVPEELKDYGMIIDTHLLILNDPNLIKKAKSYVRELGLNADWALEKAVADQEKIFSAIDDPYIRERIQDVRAVAGKVHLKLIGHEFDSSSISGRAIIMAYDLTPADTVELEVNKIMAFATVQGGKTSHTGIMARSLHIPALVGVEKLEDSVHDGDLVILDGLGGKIVTLPTEEELAEKYIDLVSVMDTNKVVFRTLDLGADKFIASFGELNEQNPAMGLRAVRFCLKHPQLFKTQLRAILRASAFGNAALMFPMICGLKEIRQAKALLAQAKAELRREKIAYDPELPVGIMVELPAAAMISDILAPEVDFFSIGTNDLIQYSLGVDRTNHNVSYLYQPLHPAALRLIKLIVDAAHQAGIEVSLCGEVASDPFCVPILLGMGIDSLSLTAQAIPGIKRIIRQTTMHDCRELLREVLACRTVHKINSLVMENIFKAFPEEVAFYNSLVES